MVINDEKKMIVGRTLIAIVNFSDAKSPKMNSVPCAVNPNKAMTRSFKTENRRSPMSVFITRIPNDTCKADAPPDDPPRHTVAALGKQPRDPHHREQPKQRNQPLPKRDRPHVGSQNSGQTPHRAGYYTYPIAWG